MATTTRTFETGARVIVGDGSIYTSLIGTVRRHTSSRYVWIKFDALDLEPIRVDAIFVRPYRPNPVGCGGGEHYHCALGCHCQCSDLDIPGAPACKAVVA